jgi:glycosyltransferase involved in cell wall biosynthesis
MTGTRTNAGGSEVGKVSAVVVSYNQAQFIAETLQSVLDQTYENIEVVIADDGSTDGTQEIISRFVQKHPAKFRAALNAENTGIASNFNRALDLCSGEFIAWLGGDDLWLPEKIKKQVDYMRAHPEVTGCHTEADVFVSETGESLGPFSSFRGRGTGTPPEGGVEVLFDARNRILPSTMLIRTGITHGHCFDERLKYTNDWLFDIEIFRTGRIGALRETLARYRRHEANVSIRGRLESAGIEETMMVLAIVSVRYPELLPLVRRRKSSLYLTQMVRAMQRGDRDRARAFLLASLKEGYKVRSVLGYAASLLGGPKVLNELENSNRFVSLVRRFL